MKFICVSIVLIFLSACGDSFKEKSKKTTLVLNTESAGNIRLYNSAYKEVEHISGNDRTDRKQFRINTKTEDFYFFHSESNKRRIHFAEPIYLQPGDSLHVLVDSLGNIDYSGDSTTVQINNKLLELIQEKIVKSLDEQYTKSPREIDSIVQRQNDHLQKRFVEIRDKYGLPEDVVTFLEKNEKYKMMNQLFSYLQYHQYYTYDNFQPLPPDTLGLNMDTILSSLNGTRLTSAYFQNVQLVLNFGFDKKHGNEEDSVKYQNVFYKKWELAQQLFSDMDRETAAYFLVKNLHLNLPHNADNYETFENTLREVESYVQERNNDFLSNNFYPYFEKVQEILPGNEAPVFSLPNREGDHVSLSDFKGKITYITFWGTWCGPCLSSVSDYIKTVEKYKDRTDIVFVFIALEYDKKEIERWKKFLDEKAFPGVHLVAKKQFFNQEIADYLIRSAPRYVLIDKSGNIINPNAPPPYKWQNELNSLLN